MPRAERPARSRAGPAVLADRLALALEAPERAESWHWLCAGALNAAEPDRRSVLEALRARRPAGAVGALLAATLLDHFTEDESELALASEAYLRSNLPPDAGLALLNLAYARALRTGAGRERFAAVLARCRFVEISARIGARLQAERGAQAPRAAAKGAPKKIAVVAPTLSRGNHAPTLMALGHACLLHEQGLEVAAFSPQEHLMPGMAHWLGAPHTMVLLPPDRDSWPRPRQGALQVTVAKAALSMRGRWHSILNAIEHFDPDAVLFVGAYSPLLWPLQARFPVAGLGVNTVAPAGPLHLWLAPAADATPTWAPLLPAPLVRAHTQRHRVPLAAEAMPRSQLGLPADAVVWTSSTTMNGHDFPAEWCERVIAALERHPAARWLLVGHEKKQPAHVPASHPRVKVVGYQPDLRPLLLACDLYLNPRRMGGGHSVAMAMAHGVPVLSLAGGDSGDKLGPLAASDEADYFSRLDLWTHDAAARRAAGAAQKERFEKVFDLGSAGPSLLDALAQAREIAHPG